MSTDKWREIADNLYNPVYEQITFASYADNFYTRVNVDPEVPAEQALRAYSNMLHDSREQCESLRRELNIVIRQFMDLQADYQRLARAIEQAANADK